MHTTGAEITRRFRYLRTDFDQYPRTLITILVLHSQLSILIETPYEYIVNYSNGPLAFLGADLFLYRPTPQSEAPTVTGSKMLAPAALNVTSPVDPEQAVHSNNKQLRSIDALYIRTRIAVR